MCNKNIIIKLHYPPCASSLEIESVELNYPPEVDDSNDLDGHLLILYGDKIYNYRK